MLRKTRNLRRSQSVSQVNDLSDELLFTFAEDKRSHDDCDAGRPLQKGQQRSRRRMSSIAGGLRLLCKRLTTPELSPVERRFRWTPARGATGTAHSIAGGSPGYRQTDRGSLLSDSSASSDESSDSRPYRGPRLCRARATVDYLPSPYDRDALPFRCGDIIDVISMSPSGLWRGALFGRVGTFKFINVEVLEEVEQAAEEAASLRARPTNVAELLRQLNLLDYQYVFSLHGFDQVEDFIGLQSDQLTDLGITEPGHRRRLLSAARALELTSPDSDDLGDDDVLCDYNQPLLSELIISSDRFDLWKLSDVLGGSRSSNCTIASNVPPSKPVQKPPETEKTIREEPLKHVEAEESLTITDPSHKVTDADSEQILGSQESKLLSVEPTSEFPLAQEVRTENPVSNQTTQELLQTDSLRPQEEEQKEAAASEATASIPELPVCATEAPVSRHAATSSVSNAQEQLLSEAESPSLEMESSRQSLRQNESSELNVVTSEEDASAPATDQTSPVVPVPQGVDQTGETEDNRSLNKERNQRAESPDTDLTKVDTAERMVRGQCESEKRVVCTGKESTDTVKTQQKRFAKTLPKDSSIGKQKVLVPINPMSVRSSEPKALCSKVAKFPLPQKISSVRSGNAAPNPSESISAAAYMAPKPVLLIESKSVSANGPPLAPKPASPVSFSILPFAKEKAPLVVRSSRSDDGTKTPYEAVTVPKKLTLFTQDIAESIEDDSNQEDKIAKDTVAEVNSAGIKFVLETSPRSLHASDTSKRTFLAARSVFENI